MLASGKRSLEPPNAYNTERVAISSLETEAEAHRQYMSYYEHPESLSMADPSRDLLLLNHVMPPPRSLEKCLHSRYRVNYNVTNLAYTKPINPVTDHQTSPKSTALLRKKDTAKITGFLQSRCVGRSFCYSTGAKLLLPRIIVSSLQNLKSSVTSGWSALFHQDHRG